MSRFGGALGAIRICVLALLAAAANADEAPDVAAGPEAIDESIEIEEPDLPGLPSDVLRIWLESRFEPSADAGDTDVSLIEPGVRVRLRAPLGNRAGLQLTGAFRTSRYDVDDQGALFEGCTGACPAPDEFYAVSLGAQGALQVNDDWFVFRHDERWAALAEGFGRARWEPGAFDKSLSGGGAIAFGYELPNKLRIALGVRIESSLDGGSVSVSPTGAFRWEITEALQLRNRGIGLQLDLRVAKPLELFVAGYRTSSRYRLHSREDLPSGSLFRDRQWLVGGGLEWRVWDLLRIAIESGAIVDRKLSLRARDEGTLDSASVDTSPYVGLRLEFRP